MRLILILSISLALFGCSTMNTSHICLNCDYKQALYDNDTPDQVSKHHACWFEKYDISKDREGKYCIFWDENGYIIQYGFDSYEEESHIILLNNYNRY